MKKPESLPQLKSANVGIITALPEEYAAMCQVLGCKDEIAVDGIGAGRKYSIAKVKAKSGGEHVVAVALLSDMGNNSAAIRATQMAHHCPEVNYFILSGIAGAIPHPLKAEDHVRLGDIVVTDRTGVVKYDFTKEEVGETKHRHAPRPPGAALLEAARSLTAREALGERPWEAIITKKISELGKAWKKPPATHDTIKDSGPEAAITPHPKDPKRPKGMPRVFHGTVASADNLLKKPEKRDAIRDKFGAKAVEMEGSGLADAAWHTDKEYLVVRGTCDYCNPAKGDEWHNYSALVAAAYTRCLIEALPASGSSIPEKTKSIKVGKKTASAKKGKGSPKRTPKTPEEIKHQRDLTKLENVFRYINFNLMDHVVESVAQGRMLYVSEAMFQGASGVMTSSSFELYDSELDSLLNAFVDTWRESMKYAYAMDPLPNGQGGYFRMPGDCPTSIEQGQQFDYTQKQWKPLRATLAALRKYVRKNYLEIDLDKTGDEEVKAYWAEDEKLRKQFGAKK